MTFGERLLDVLVRTMEEHPDAIVETGLINVALNVVTSEKTPTDLRNELVALLDEIGWE